MAEALEALPETSEALSRGEICWSAARELTRVATPETEHDWLDAARGRTVRDVEELVAGHMPGDRPEDAVRGPRREVLRLELSPEALATFREAVGKLRRDAGGQLDEEEAVLLMARQVLGGPKDEGRASYQVGMTVCGRCGRGWQQGLGNLIAVGPEVVEMAQCDAQHLGSTHVGQTPARATQEIPPAIRRQVVRRDHGRCAVPGCRCAVFLDVHHLDPRAEGGGHDPDGLVLVCAAHHRALHRGFLFIEGRVSTGLVYRHADGTLYGGAPHPQAASALADAFQALRALGFREIESRRALDAIRAHVGASTSAEVIVRLALSAMRGSSAAAAA